MVEKNISFERFNYFGFEELPLPEFNDEEKRIRSLKFNVSDFLAEKKIVDVTGTIFFREVDKAVQSFALDRLRELNLPEAYLKDGEEKIQHQGGALSFEATFVWREFNAKINRLRCEVIDNHLAELGLNKVVECEFKALLPAFPAMDALYIKLATELNGASVELKDKYKNRKQLGFNNPCAVLRERKNGQLEEVPFHVAFQTETDVMIHCYENLLQNLENLEKSPAPATDISLKKLITLKKRYYKVILEALKTSDPKKWHEAECLYTSQIRDENDAIHVLFMETTYMSDDPSLMVPDLHLRLPDHQKVDLQRRINKIKKQMIRSFKSKDFKDCKGIKEIIALLEKSNAVLRYSLDGGYSSIDTYISGEALPVSPGAIAKGGVDSYLNPVIPKAQIELFEKVFGTKATEKSGLKASLEDTDYLVADLLTTHELGHVIGIVIGLLDRLDYQGVLLPYVEEFKASMAMLVSLYIPYKNNKKTEKDLRKWIVMSLFRAMKWVQRRERDGFSPYFREAIITLNIMEECGVLQKDPDSHPTNTSSQTTPANSRATQSDENLEYPWKINLDKKNLINCMEKFLNCYKRLIDIYVAGSNEDMEEFIQKALQPSEFIKFACTRLAPASPPPEHFAKPPAAIMEDTSSPEKIQTSSVEEIQAETADLLKGKKEPEQE